MFRFQDNLPEVYVNESRDFQLLCRLSDILFSGLKYEVDSIINLLDATQAKDQIIRLMCTKVGFFPTIEIDSQILKYIVASFPLILKYKGTLKGIQYAANAILKGENNQNTLIKPLIIIENKTPEYGRDPYTVYIYTPIEIKNKPALKEILKYCLPAGYASRIESYYKAGSENPDLLKQMDLTEWLKINRADSSKIRVSDSEAIGINKAVKEKSLDTYVGAFDIMEIATSDYTSTLNTPDVQIESVYLQSDVNSNSNIKVTLEETNNAN